MKVVIDTNVLPVSFSTRSKSYWLFQAIRDGVLHLYITNEILIEYEEMFSSHWNKTVAEDMTRILLELQTTHKITAFFKFNLIPFDMDDNKFVDCAIAANAKYLVTNDKHFNILKEIPFPSVTTLSLDAFEQVLRNENLI